MNIVAIVITLTTAQASGAVARDIRLTAANAVFTSVTVLNTHHRRFVDADRPSPPGTPNECLLEAKSPGVIWKIVLHGAAAPADDIVVTDEKSITLAHVCWSSSGNVFQLDAAGNRSGGGPRTEFLVAGAETAERLTFTIGKSRATISVGAQK